MAVLLTNNARSLLANSISTLDTEIRVRAGTGGKFPVIVNSDQWFPITLEDANGNIEIMKVTARNGDVFTVQRGFEGTAPRAFSANDVVDLRLTVAALNELAADSATIFSKIYRTPAEGVDPEMGVPSGYFYSVRSSLSDAYVDEYQNVNGVAVATGKSYPSGAVIEQIRSDVSDLQVIPGGMLTPVDDWVDVPELDDVDGLPHPTANLQAQALLNRTAVLRKASGILDASGKTQQEINNGLESITEMLAIANPQTGMRVHVNSYNAPNYALAKPHYGGGTFIYDASKSPVNDDGLVLFGWVRQDYSVFKPEFFGADPNNQVDCSSAFNKCFAAARGRAIELDGHYKFTSPIVVDYANTGTLKMYGQGSGMHDGQNGIQKTVLDFDALPAESVAITFKRIRGLKLSDFHITHSTLFDDSSTTCWITTLDDFEIERVTLKNTNGASSTGFRFGLTDGNDCAFMGTVKNCEINMLRGRATAILPACTSINHINCYQQGGYFYSYKSQYCKYDNCASEGSPNFGYIAEDTKSLTYISCAGEANALGVFTVKRGCSNIEYISPYGAANQGVFGVLLFIDGSLGYNANIKVTNPVSISNPNAQFDIYADGVNGILEVSNVYAPNLPHNIGGSAAWKEACLMVTGDLVVDDSFTATPNGFIAATPPTVTGAYTRAGNTVEILIKVTPTASTTTDANTTITIPTFGGIRLDSVGTVVSQNNTSRGNCFVSANGVIQMPVISSGTTSPLYIRATLITIHTPS